MIGFSISPAYAGVATCELFDLGGGNFGGIQFSSFTCTVNDAVDPPTIMIDETWISFADSYIFFSGLQKGQIDYEVTKVIHNSLPNLAVMDSFSHELHDRDNGSPSNDDLDQKPCGVPGSNIPDALNDVCPTGFTRSNEPDGLSFAQGADEDNPSTARNSDAFSTVAPDEFNLIDFLDWEGDAMGHPGQICNTAAGDDLTCTDDDFDTQTFGIRDENRRGLNQPFLLRESQTLISPPMIGGEIVSSDFAVLAIAGMKDNAFNILGILSLVGVSAFAALYFTVKRKSK